MDDLALVVLLAVSIILSILLVLASTATLGRKLADLEYQYAANLDGIRRIQSWVNLRTHANRVLLGLAFLATSILSLADAPLLWRTWVGRVVFIVVLASYATASVMDWFDERKQVHLLLAEQAAERGAGRTP